MWKHRLYLMCLQDKNHRNVLTVRIMEHKKWCNNIDYIFNRHIVKPPFNRHPRDQKPVHFRDRSANGRLKMLHLYIAETIVVAVCLQEERLDCTIKLGSKTSRDNQWKSNIHAVLPISFTNSPESTWTLAFSTKYQPAVCHHWILWLGF